MTELGAARFRERAAAASSTSGATQTPLRLLTAREAGDVLGEHEQTVRKHTRQGHYPFARNIGTDRAPRWRYDPRALEHWLESRAMDLQNRA